MQILKSDPSRHEITACVYCCFGPGGADSQGDYIEPEDRGVLEKAEASFLRNPTFNVDHDDGQILGGLEVLESYITDTDEKIGDKIVGPNCWIIKVSVPDHLYDDLEKGNGISMQGSGQYEEK